MEGQKMSGRVSRIVLFPVSSEAVFGPLQRSDKPHTGIC